MTRPYPTGVFPRGAKLYIKLLLPSGKWKQAATGYNLDEGERADELRRMTQDQLDSGVVDDIGPISVADWARKWLKVREQDATIVTFKDDKGRIDNHLQRSALGRMTIADVRPRHVRTWVQQLRASGMAPRTVRNVAGVVSTMFRDAVIEEVIHASPFVLRRGDLPGIVDKNPEWRSGAIFTRAEVETIISAPAIAMDRRVLYALAFLTGARAGEVFALRFRHIDRELEPLGRIVIAGSYSTKLLREKSTKTQTVRLVPIHPVLASMLAQWRLSGWEEAFGRKPTDDDLIVPSRLNKERPRSGKSVLRRFHEDLKLLKLRRRRLHDARRTFRSLCADDGGSERAIEWIVYGRKASVSGRYDEPSWKALCDPVEKLKVAIRDQPTAPIKRGAIWCMPNKRPRKAVKHV